MSTFPFPNIVPSQTSWSLVSNTGIHRSPLSGAIQTRDRDGEHWRVRMSFKNLTSAERGQLQSFISQMNGQQHRCVLYDHANVKRGSISVSQLLGGQTDDVLNTSWSPQSWQTIVALDNGGIRIRRTGNDTNGATNAPAAITVVTAASYAAAVAMRAYTGLAAKGDHIRITDGSIVIFQSGQVAFLSERKPGGFTAPGTSIVCGISDQPSGVNGSYFDLLGYHVARALLVDNGFNALTRSAEFENADWIKTRSSVTANADSAPDGSTTADRLVEDSTANSTHWVQQLYTRSSVAEFWTASIYIRQNTSQRIRLAVSSASNITDNGSAFFDANTGTISLSATSAGAATDAYASIHDVGGGWYRCRVSAKIPASTIAALTVNLADGASNTTLYSGDGTSNIRIWGAQLQRGGQLGRYKPTTSAAILGTNQTGAQIWLKGLDSSVNGQLLAGDQIEINGQLLRLTSDLDGDPSAVGLAQVTPKIRTAPSDEAAAILYRPHGTFLLANPSNSWNNRPGGFSDFTLDFIEDIAS